jgi:molecular chaperone GrpE (heat shock protein)
VENHGSGWTGIVLDAMAQYTAEPKESSPRQILLNFLDVLDSLERLVTIADLAADQSGSGASDWSEHLYALRRQMLDAFEQAGVTFFDCVGQPFDPERQEAVKTVQRHDVDDYTVVEEIARGCERRGEVLRFARVIVARNTV